MPGRVAQNLVVDLARWLVPMSIEGALPGATGREQTPGGMVLASLGVGSHSATASGQMYQAAAEFNRHGDAKTQKNQLRRDAEPSGNGDYRKLDDLLDAGDLKGAQREYDALKADGKSPDTIQKRYNRFAPFTGNATQEQKFKASLSPEQQKVYAKALAEHQTRVQAFSRLAK
jgi:hypothetical protein